MLRPPYKKLSRTKKWTKRKKFQLKHILEYFFAGIFSVISKLLNLYDKTFDRLKKSVELGNPYSSVWPRETIPMVSRILSAGFWNYSFFQFNRGFYFPYWAHKQYNPSSSSFIPRSHNILSINQTHRNWVSISFPGKREEVCIDPAGAVMPFTDSATIEFAVIEKKKDSIKLVRPHDFIKKIKIETSRPGMVKLSFLGRELILESKQNSLIIDGKGSGNIIMAVRPFNMEGPAHISKLEISYEKRKILGEFNIDLKNLPDYSIINNLENGDSLKKIYKPLKAYLKEKINLTSLQKKYLKKKKLHISKVKDKQGIITGSFFYADVKSLHWEILDKSNNILSHDLVHGLTVQKDGNYRAKDIWKKWFGENVEVSLPSTYSNIFSHMQNHILTLWDFDSVTPGSYTYHHFWIRDAVIMLDAYLMIGGARAVRRILTEFPKMINRKGFFKSQAGEWDANGQALWIIGRYVEYTDDTSILKELNKPIKKMVNWIDKTSDKYHGVLPPGFSAEHLGIADWYLWDNFWALGGLQILSIHEGLFKNINFNQVRKKIDVALKKYLKKYSYYPAALGRRKDAGMIGSISAVYPLKLTNYFNVKMRNTLNIIKKNFFYEKGGFFQDNIHSGINPYLTVELAQAFLHLGESKKAKTIFEDLMKWTNVGYTFPEALHPKTGGGCMGDGFHGWAFAEILIFMKNLFFISLPIKNETKLQPILLHGLDHSWLTHSKPLEIRNFYTEFGKVSLRWHNSYLTVIILADKTPKNIYISLPKGMYRSVQYKGHKIYTSKKLFLLESEEKRDYFVITNLHQDMEFYFSKK